MCNFNSYKMSKEEVRLQGFEVKQPDINIPLAGFHEFPEWPVVVKTDSGYDTTLMNWTLIPSWANSVEEAARYSTQNAVLEDVFNKNSFKGAVKKHRCLVLSSGFYEWRHLPKIGKKGELLKTTEAFPYFIKEKGKEVFFMAGIWNPWDRNGQFLNTFTICTQPANKVMQAIHNKLDAKTGKPKHRMPVILDEDRAAKWLDPNLTDAEISAFASVSLPDTELEYYTIAKDFKTAANPQAPAHYDQVPEIVI